MIAEGRVVDGDGSSVWSTEESSSNSSSNPHPDAASSVSDPAGCIVVVGCSFGRMVGSTIGAEIGALDARGGEKGRVFDRVTSCLVC